MLNLKGKFVKYNIPKMWDNEPCYIIGGGWSLKGFDVSVLKGKNIIGVNNAFKLADFITFCWFGDFQWYGWNLADITMRRLKSSFSTSFVSCHNKFENHPFIYHVERTGGCGINTKENKVRWNYCSGFSAINFAYHLGANPIILLGFDMKPNPNNPKDNNYHQEHQVKLRKIYNPYTSYLRAVESIKKDANELNIKIFNVTTDSGISEDIFKWISIEKAVSL